MGAAPSTPRRGISARPQDAAEHLIGTFVGEKSYPVTSDFWEKLLGLPLTLQWPQRRVLQACEAFAQNNGHTRHMGKILLHLVWRLQEAVKTSSDSSAFYGKAINAAYISSIFLKYIIENSKTNKFEELHLSIQVDEDHEATKYLLPKGENLAKFVMCQILTFIGGMDVSPSSCLLHHVILNFMLVALSTQLSAGPSPGMSDVHPFIDAAMAQESPIVCSVVRRLLLNYITRPHIPINDSGYPIFSDDNQPGVLERFGSAAASFVLLPYYTFNFLVSSSGEGSRSPLADNSLFVLLVLVHYQRCMPSGCSLTYDVENGGSESYLKDNSQVFYNPYSNVLENARDIEFDRLDIEDNAHNGLLIRLPYAALYDTLGLCLCDENSILLLYSLVHGNSNFLEYVFVRIDIDTLLMPILEALYNASRRTPNHIYMLLVILLILSQDSSFNASIHKLVLPSVPWFQERLLHNTSLGSLIVIVLIRTVKYILSRLQDIYLLTNCLAILTNMAPHVHRLTAYASQKFISLFDMLSYKYTKLAEQQNDKIHNNKFNDVDDASLAEDMSTELHIYTDFLRIVLEIINAILTYAITRNPEMVYAILHQQEVFHPFKSHPLFNELLENIYTVLNFFNSCMDTQQIDGEWSVDKVLEVIIVNCRSWHGEGVKMFNQLKFTYEQESHPEEFFIPYIWQLILSQSVLSFNAGAINLFPVELHVKDTPSHEDV